MTTVNPPEGGSPLPAPIVPGMLSLPGSPPFHFLPQCLICPPRVSVCPHTSAPSAPRVPLPPQCPSPAQLRDPSATSYRQYFPWYQCLLPQALCSPQPQCIEKSSNIHPSACVRSADPAPESLQLRSQPQTPTSPAPAHPPIRPRHCRLHPPPPSQSRLRATPQTCPGGGSVPAQCGGRSDSDRLAGKGGGSKGQGRCRDLDQEQDQEQEQDREQDQDQDLG